MVYIILITLQCRRPLEPGAMAIDATGSPSSSASQPAPDLNLHPPRRITLGLNPFLKRTGGLQEAPIELFEISP
jgi:hypothetical protein